SFDYHFGKHRMMQNAAVLMANEHILAWLAEAVVKFGDFSRNQHHVDARTGYEKPVNHVRGSSDESDVRSGRKIDLVRGKRPGLADHDGFILSRRDFAHARMVEGRRLAQYLAQLLCGCAVDLSGAGGEMNTHPGCAVGERAEEDDQHHP